MKKRRNRPEAPADRGSDNATERPSPERREGRYPVSSIEIATPETSVREEVLAQEAYERVEPEMDALPPEKVMQVNLDIKNITATGLGCKPKFAAMRRQFEEHLRKFDTGVVDKVEDYAYALIFANSLHQLASEPQDDLKELAQQGSELRETLHSDASAAIRRKLLPANVLDGFSGLMGYKLIAADLQMLSTAFGISFHRIEGRCATTRSEIDLASRIAGRITRLVGLREQAPALIAEAADKRARAFTLYVNCYNEIRRAVTYVRWNEDDIDDIAPSLYGGRKRQNAEPDEKPAEPATPVPPTNNATPVIRNLDSLPGGSPFMS